MTDTWVVLVESFEFRGYGIGADGTLVPEYVCFGEDLAAVGLNEDTARALADALTSGCEYPLQESYCAYPATAIHELPGYDEAHYW